MVVEGVWVKWIFIALACLVGRQRSIIGSSVLSVPGGIFANYQGVGIS